MSSLLLFFNCKVSEKPFECLHPFLGAAGSPDTSYKPGAEQMERGEITQSHLLVCSMIHVAADDGYSPLSLSISLSLSLFLSLST